MNEVLALGVERSEQFTETFGKVKHYNLMIDWMWGENLKDVLRTMS